MKKKGLNAIKDNFNNIISHKNKDKENFNYNDSNGSAESKSTEPGSGSLLDKNNSIDALDREVNQSIKSSEQTNL